MAFPDPLEGKSGQVFFKGPHKMRLIPVCQAPWRRIEVVVDSLLKHFFLILLYEGEGLLFTHFDKVANLNSF